MKKTVRTFCALLVLAMVLGLLPGMSRTAHAATDTYTALMNNRTVVKFNGYNWYIMADDSTATGGTVTLLAADESFGTMKFRYDARDNSYNSSDVKAYLDKIVAGTAGAGKPNFKNLADVIEPVTLTTNGVDETTPNAKLWLLRGEQAEPYKDLYFDGPNYGGWLTRSPGISSEHVAVVWGGQSGSVNWVGDRTDNREYGVRPALKLNLSKVAFDSTTKTFLPHAHSFSYSVSGATITATCNGAGTCNITSGKTLTISAPTGNLVYNGTTTNKAATLSTGYNTTAFPGTYSISYKKDGSAYSGLPKDAGTYTASVTVGTGAGAKTASVSYTIAKAAAPNASTLTDAQKPTAKTGNDVVYTGSALALVTAPTSLPTGYTAVQYSTDGGQNWSSTIPTGINAGDYTVKVKYTSNNYNDLAGFDVPVTITKAAAPDIGTLTDAQKPTAKTGNDVVYTGSALALVTAPTSLPTGYTGVKYSTDSGMTWSSTIPTGINAGNYYLWYKLVGDSNHFDTASASMTVQIERAIPTIEFPVRELYYTGSYQNLVVDPVITPAQGVTVWYSLDDGENELMRSPIEKQVGAYTLCYRIVGNDNYKDVAYGDNEPVVIRIIETPVLSMDGYTYGDNEPSVPSLSGAVEGADIAYYYSETKSNENGTAWVNMTGTSLDAGTYYLYATAGEVVRGNGTKVAAFTTAPLAFTVSPREVTEPAITFDPASPVYTGTAIKPTVSVKDDAENEVAATEYTVSYSSNTNVGTATVTLTDVEGGNYIISGSAQFTIARADITPTVSLEGWTYGDEANTPSVTGNSGNGAVTYSYKQKDADAAAYVSEVPTDANVYTVKAEIAATDNYNSATATAEFTIARADITPTISLEGWTYGDDANEPTLTGNSGNGTVTYSYKQKDADDTAYDTAVPTDADDYIIKAEIAETTNYNSASATAEFTISKKTPVLGEDFSIEGLQLSYTGAFQDLVSSVTNSLQVKFSYYKDGTNELVRTPRKKLPGEYPIYYRVIGNSNYESLDWTGPVTATIGKADPTANAPTGLTATYGQTLADVSLEGKNPEGNTPGTWAWADSTESVGNVVSPAATFKATFTPTSSDYKTVENVDVTVTVNKADATTAMQAASVSIASRSGKTATVSYTLPDGASYGTVTNSNTEFFTVDTTSGLVLTAAKSWTASDWATDASKTFTVAVSGATNYNDYTLTVTVTPTIVKGTPTISTAPTASDIILGQALSNSTLTGGTASVPGTFAWKDGTVVPALTDSQTTAYTVVFTPEDTANYEGVETTVTLTVIDPDQVAADGIADTLNGLPAEPALTDMQSVKDARAAYEALTPEQKEKVDSDALQKLIDAEQAVFTLYAQKKAEDLSNQLNENDTQEIVEKVDGYVQQLNTLTYDETKTLDENLAAADEISRGGTATLNNYRARNYVVLGVKTTLGSPIEGKRYQWQYQRPGKTKWYKATGRYKLREYTFTPKMKNEGYIYRCKVTLADGSVAYTDEIPLHVLAIAPTLTLSPEAVTNAISGNKVTLHAEGLDYATFRWQVRKPGASKWSSVGSRNKDLTVTASAKTNGNQYRCAFINPTGTVYSDVTELVVELKAPVITEQPQDVTAAVKAKATFTVAAEGAQRYVWYYQAPGTDTWKKASGGSGATLKVAVIADKNGYQYRCDISNADGTITSDIATLTVE